MKATLLILLSVLSFTYGMAQNMDSLQLVLKNAKHDSTKAGALNAIGEVIYSQMPDSALKLWISAKTIVENNLSNGKYSNHEIKVFKRQLAGSLNNIGVIYQKQGDISKAIEFYSRSLKFHEEIGDKKGIADNLNNIGLIYSSQDDIPKTLEYYDRSMKILEEIGDKKGTVQSLFNIGRIYIDLGDFSKALEYSNRGLTIAEEIGDKNAISQSLNNIGIFYHHQGDFTKAEEYYGESLAIRKEIGFKNGIIWSLHNLGVVCFLQKDFRKAEEYLNQSMEMSQELGFPEDIRNAAEQLSRLYKAMGKHDLALENHELFIQMRDSINNIETQKATIKQQTQYEFEKKELALKKEAELSALQFEYEKKQAAARTEKEKQQLRYEEELKRTQIEADYAQRQAAMEAEQKQKDALAKAEQDKKDAIATEQLRRKNQQRNAFIGGFALTLGLAGVSYRSYRRKKRDNTIITAQKEVVEKKNHAILESITYARKLQEAVLPPPKVVKEFFHDSFLLYLPRDIVSGDFYWMESKDGVSLFALGDCTGHGVPGAMLSVMGLNGLNRALNELHISQPADFLTQLTKDLHDAFQRSDSMVRDGMDLSICALDSTNRKLTYAGANNPLWIARNGEIIVHKPNKRPVGHHDMEGEGFSQVTIDLQAGDTIYLMTDGYADQLGGPNGLKMMTKVFRERLAQLSSLPLPQQREQLIADLDAWKGSGSQTDDVCVMGVRV